MAAAAWFAAAPAWPMGYLRTFGPRADPATALTWGLGLLSLTVTVIVAVLVVTGVLARRARPAPQLPPVQREGGGLEWITIGLGLTVVALAASLIWTVAVLAKITSPAHAPTLTIEVTGHQWWWEARYLSADPTQVFTTANELHVPVGRSVLVRLMSADVIHSFWIPALTGKTETIPGRTNIAWLQADQPGVYRGQCAEFCGAQHAHMALFVVAQDPAAFEAWRQAQVAPAAAGQPSLAQGQAVFDAHCGACHTVRGTSAGGVIGPDLTHLMSRQTIASGMLPNTEASLGGWVSDPQALKPDAQMPAANLSGPDLRAVTAYLESLK